MVYQFKYFVQSSPEMPHNCKDDGGHLVMWKREKVADRLDLPYQEAIDFMRISMAVGKAMYEVLGFHRKILVNTDNTKNIDATEVIPVFISPVQVAGSTCKSLPLSARLMLA
jgi:hypothetical protein